MSTNVITQKIHNKKKTNLIGLFVAFVSNKGELKVGVSVCHKHDKFDKKKGHQLALQHAKSNYREVVYPTAAKADVAKFIERAERFFKFAPPKVAETNESGYGSAYGA